MYATLSLESQAIHFSDRTERRGRRRRSRRRKDPAKKRHLKVLKKSSDQKLTLFDCYLFDFLHEKNMQ
jgi:hypothetical protein